jgi:hypothetical protein
VVGDAVVAAMLAATSAENAAKIQASIARRVAIIGAIAAVFGGTCGAVGSALTSSRAAITGPMSARIEVFYDRHVPRCKRLPSRGARARCYQRARAALSLTSDATPL